MMNVRRPPLFSSALSLLGLSLLLVKRTGAVPSAEFPAAAIAYPAAPYLWIGGLLLALIFSAPLLRRRALRIPAALAAVTAGAGCLPIAVAPLLLTVGLVALNLLSWWQLAVDGATPNNSQTGLKADLTRFPSFRDGYRALLVAGAATLVSTLIALLESVLTMPRFVPDLLPETTYRTHQWLCLPLSLGFGLQIGAGFFVALLLAPFLSRILLVNSGASAWPNAVHRVSLALGLGVGFRVLTALTDSLGAQFEELGVLPLLVGVFVLLAIAVAVFHARGWSVDPELTRRDGQEHWARLALWSGIRCLQGAGIRNRTGATIVFLFVCLLFSIAMLPALYPTVDDYRVEALPAYGMLVIFLLTWALIVKWRWLLSPRITLAASVLILLAGGALQPELSKHPELGQVHIEMSRLGRILKGSPVATWLQPFEHIGDEASSTPFVLDHPTQPTPEREKEPPLLIFLLWDAGRPDRLSPYGHGRDTTPALQEIAGESVVFQTARSNSTATTHGTRSLLSGNYVSRHMLGTNHPPFLTQYLALGGYRQFIITVAGTDFNGVSLEAFQRNWTSQPTEPVQVVAHDPAEDDGNKKDAWKNDQVIKSLQRRHKEVGHLNGVFVYIHLVGPHYPWIETKYGTSPADRYDSHLSAADALLGTLHRSLKEMNAWEDAVFVLTADHGTALGEHGRLAGYLTYEEQVRIPLIMKLPGITPQRVSAPIAGIDVVPTLLDAVHAPRPPHFHGESFLPFLLGTGKAPHKDYLITSCAFRDAYAIYDPEHRFKLHHDREHRYEALYDLKSDPTERSNLIRTHPEQADHLRERLSAWLFLGRGAWATPHHY